MNNMTNGSVRSDLTKERTMARLRADGFCFEGDRYAVRPSADSKYASKGRKK
jgi:hypothetical protein